MVCFKVLCKVTHHDGIPASQFSHCLRVFHVLAYLYGSPEGGQWHCVDVVHLLDLVVSSTLDLQLSFEMGLFHEVVELHDFSEDQQKLSLLLRNLLSEAGYSSFNSHYLHSLTLEIFISLHFSHGVMSLGAFPFVVD